MSEPTDQTGPVDVTVTTTRPVDDDEWDAYWRDLLATVRAYATHGIEAEFETEWRISVDPADLEMLWHDLADLAAEYGQTVSVAAEAGAR